MKLTCVSIFVNDKRESCPVVCRPHLPSANYLDMAVSEFVFYYLDIMNDQHLLDGRLKETHSDVNLVCMWNVNGLIDKRPVNGKSACKSIGCAYAYRCDRLLLNDNCECSATTTVNGNGFVSTMFGDNKLFITFTDCELRHKAKERKRRNLDMRHLYDKRRTKVDVKRYTK